VKGSPDPAHERYVEYLFDASGSMRDPVNGRPKLAMAKAVLQTVIANEDPSSRVGLRVFGSKPGLSGSDSCLDSELVVPVGPGGVGATLTALDRITANGNTPIAESLRRAAEDFTFVPTRLNAVVLVTDGEETCGGDPVALVTALRARGIDITVHVVALDVDAAARAQLSAIAAAGNGVYWDARSEDELRRAVSDVNERSLRLVAPAGGGAAAGTASTPAAPGFNSANTYAATFKTTAGDFQVRLFADAAPETVRSFVSLARKGFYDGQEFYRVSKGFVIATGDPLKTGTGDAGYGTKLEPSQLRNARGTLSVGLRPDVGTVGSQFFLNLVDNIHLDFDNGQPWKYYPFGTVTEGMSVVDAIGNGAVGADDRPLAPVRIIAVTITETAAPGSAPATALAATPLPATSPAPGGQGAPPPTSTPRPPTAAAATPTPLPPTATPTVPPTVTVTNLAVNGGFETGALGAPWGTGIYEPRPQSEGVFWGAANADATVVSGEAHSGAYSLRIANRSPAAPNVYRTLSQKVKVAGGAAHCLTWWAKTQGGTSGMLTFRLNDAWTSAIGMGAGTPGWTQYGFTFTAEDGDIDLRIVSENTGTVWIDDIVLTQGGCKVPNGTVAGGASPR
jgi:cyclophilin family peptidyl-prolyl cis-trans isomerase